MQIIVNGDTRPIPFLMVQSADHISGLTGATPTVTISKNGGAFTSPSGTTAQIANGWYAFTPSGSDTTTNGVFLLHATAASGDPTDIICQVTALDVYTIVSNQVWDALRSAHTVANSFGAATVTPPTNFSSLAITAGGIVQADIQTVLTNAVTATVSGILDVNAKNLGNQAVSAAAGVTFPSSVASPTNITAGTITTVTNLTNAATSGDLTSTMKTSVTTAATAATPTAAAVTGAVGSVTGSVGSVVGNVGGNVTGSVGSIASGGITAGSFAAFAEGYTTLGTGSTYTMANMIFDIHRRLYGRTVSGTTETIVKMDGSTTAHTLTLNSSSAPTSAIQAT